MEAEAWLREKKQQQDSLPKYANPVLLSADIRKKAEAVDRYVPLFRRYLDYLKSDEGLYGFCPGKNLDAIFYIFAIRLSDQNMSSN